MRYDNIVEYLKKLEIHLKNNGDEFNAEVCYHAVGKIEELDSQISDTWFQAQESVDRVNHEIKELEARIETINICFTCRNMGIPRTCSTCKHDEREAMLLVDNWEEV